MIRIWLSVLVLALGACSGDDDDGGGAVVATITDDPDVIDMAGDDLLFLFEVTASDMPYAMADLTLFVALDPSGVGQLGAGKQLMDRDADGMLGAGDAVLASEGGTNHWDPEDAGERIEVKLRFRWGTAEERELFDGVWAAE